MNTAPDIAQLRDDAMTLYSSSLAAVPGGARREYSDIAIARWTDFYELTKPRMNFLVLITTMVGYYMAARSWWDWAGVIHTLIGTALTAAGASVLNQYIERDDDAKMPRTANRPLPGGRIGPIEALFYGVFLGAGGIIYLMLLVNPITALLGVITLGSYVFVYTPLKRRTTLCTIVGAVPGAIPPVMGWTAVTGHFSAEAWALFGILFFWQMPHFLAIAILYKDDYAAGGFKMLPVVDEKLSSTSRQIILWGVALIPVSLVPTLLGMAGIGYLLTAVLLGLGFLTFGVLCAISRQRLDARRLFLASIIYLPLLLAVMMTDKR